ncbi:attacin-like [Papilio machaon]|uniref:attacin-like n=1 Tax=Papilio machaon TaxID=76193 RepID=UPI001E66488D|nr:attacin-like [Papilio machaon]
MYSLKVLVIAAIMIGASSRSVPKQRIGSYVLEEDDHMLVYALEDDSSEAVNTREDVQPQRVRRQAHGSINTNPDGSSNVAAKIPIARGDSNVLSAIGSVNAANGKGGFSSAGGGLAWDNIKGHGATLTASRIPGVADQLTAAGKTNLFHDDHHDITASAFATRTFPDKPNFPTFDTYGGKVGYTFNDKIGASLGAAHTDLFKKTDYSAMGNLNLFKDRTSSLDLNAGWSKSVSPYIPNSRWEPSGGLSFTRFF